MEDSSNYRKSNNHNNNNIHNHNNHDENNIHNNNNNNDHNNNNNHNNNYNNNKRKFLTKTFKITHKINPSNNSSFERLTLTTQSLTSKDEASQAEVRTIVSRKFLILATGTSSQ